MNVYATMAWDASALGATEKDVSSAVAEVAARLPGQTQMLAAAGAGSPAPLVEEDLAHVAQLSYQPMRDISFGLFPHPCGRLDPAARLHTTTTAPPVHRHLGERWLYSLWGWEAEYGIVPVPIVHSGWSAACGRPQQKGVQDKTHTGFRAGAVAQIP